MKKHLLIGLTLTTLLLTACQSDKAPAGDNYSQVPSSSASTNQNTNSMQTQGPKTGDTIATLETDQGTIKFKLFTEQAPETTKNFIELAKSGKYDGVPFHRVIPDFMIQTGDFTNKNGTGGYSYKGPDTMIDDEFSPGLVNLKGTVSMANAGPNTNGSQFFIVTAAQGTPWLNGKHTVFGQVFEGQDVADKISMVQTGLRDAPLTPVTIKKVTISTF
jgi:cyclophilin family peptidyl-prolyl cis-trans isomerase